MSARDDLLHAILGDDTDRVRELLAADPSLAAADGADSPILTALYRGRAESLGALLGTQPEVTAFEAVALGIDELVAAFLAEQPELVTTYTPDGFTVLHMAAYFGQVAVATLLLDSGADVAAVSQDDAEGTPLHAAVAARHHGMAWLLLARGAPVNAQQAGGFTALHVAARFGDHPIVQLLIVNGADPWLQADNGKTAADIAYEFDHDAEAAYLRTHMA
jgi:ankyrin repeat protein